MVYPTMENIKPMYLSRDALSKLWSLEEKLQKGAVIAMLASGCCCSCPLLVWYS
jgi:hypothetical protein